MDYKGLKAIPNMPREEVVIMLVVLILSVFWDLVFAVGIGMVIAALIFMKKMADITANDSEIRQLKEETDLAEYWKDEANFPVKLKEEVYIKHLNGPLFFGYINDFQALVSQIPKTASHVVIRMDRVPYMDQSGLFAMEDVLSELWHKEIKPLFVHLDEQPRLLMENIDIIPDLVPEKHIFDDFNECLKWINENVEDVH